METSEWLNIYAPGFNALTSSEKSAILEFTFLWSLFEGHALHTHASAALIRQLVTNWSSESAIDLRGIEKEMTYFQSRYFQSGLPTTHYIDYGGLNLRRNDLPELVESFLKKETDDPVLMLTAVLIIVFRLRNNLFHGLKWVFEIRGQEENFRNACQILMYSYKFFRVD